MKCISICNAYYKIKTFEKLELARLIKELIPKYTCSVILLRYSFLSGADLRDVHLNSTDLNLARSYIIVD